MAAKCNIIGLVLAKLESLRYGTKVDNGSSIVENYIEYLECDSINFKPCLNSDCNNDPVDYDCFYTAGAIKIVTLTGQPLGSIVFTLDNVDRTVGYTHVWSYDTDLFTRTANADGSLLILTPTGSNDLDNIVSLIEVTVTDLEGCSSNRQCYYVNTQGMKCIPYEPCLNNFDLAVTTVQTLCGANTNLLVN